MKHICIDIGWGYGAPNDKNFYFVRANRDDDFGVSTLIETSGGGVEEGEDLLEAIHRELKEELGIESEIICKIELSTYVCS